MSVHRKPNATVSKVIRVLVVDDSAVVRQVLSRVINRHPQLSVVGTAADPYIARDKIKQLSPDVLTLDIEMPRMDGHQFLRNLMRLHPMPVVMVSSLTGKGADATLLALELGAVDFMCKPAIGVADNLELFGNEVCEKLLLAAKVDPERLRRVALYHAPASRKSLLTSFRKTNQLLAIGASTGGTQALDVVLSKLPPDTPGTVVVQHIPGSFSGPLARRLNDNSAMEVKEAADNEQILQGHVYLAPGSKHLSVVRDGAFYRCRLSDDEPVNRHRPSVDVLFDTVAECAPNNALAVILTGMGSDGAKGMLNVKQSGSPTIAQDKPSSVVWGMPGSAVKLGAADRVLPLSAIAGQICEYFAVGKAA